VFLIFHFNFILKQVPFGRTVYFRQIIIFKDKIPLFNIYSAIQVLIIKLVNFQLIVDLKGMLARFEINPIFSKSICDFPYNFA